MDSSLTGSQKSNVLRFGSIKAWSVCGILLLLIEAVQADTQGYWLVGSDGAIFPFGNAGGFGSTGGMTLSHPIVGMEATPNGQGYWLVGSEGALFPFCN